MAEKKYIELATLFKTVEDYASTHPVMRDNELFSLFCSVPAADVRPVTRGKWTLFGRRGIYGVMYECSACHAKYDGITNFCPNCGAIMEES